MQHDIGLWSGPVQPNGPMTRRKAIRAGAKQEIDRVRELCTALCIELEWCTIPLRTTLLYFIRAAPSAIRMPSCQAAKLGPALR